MKMTGAQAIIKALELEGTEIIFGYPGAAISPFYDALLDSSVRHILTRHEQGAAHAANGYARVTGKTGVCVATSGPGATNLITGIANAYMDSIPIIAITGQVPCDQIGRDVFQEADITGSTAPFCKHNYLVKKAEDLPRVIKEAFHIASTGRPGPVVIDVPIDVQTKTIEFKYPESVEIRGYKPTYKGHAMQIRKVAEALDSAKAPVICAGGGVITARATEELQQLAEKCRIPVTTTLMGIGSIPSGHELNFGMVGTHGSFTANHALHSADLLVILGARVGDRAISAANKIAQKARIVHIDIDPAEIGKNIDVSIPVVGDVKLVLTDLLRSVKGTGDPAWVESLQKQKQQRTKELGKGKGHVDPRYLMSLLSDYVGEDAIITTEVGQNQIWAANNLRVSKPRTFITSGGLGTMGYGLPSAVGVKLGRPGTAVVTVSGDGSFQMSLQELGTIRQYGLDIKIILMNNSRLGMVRELQKNKHQGRYSEVFMEHNPDFIKLMEAYGFKGERITENSEVEGALKRMAESDGTYLLECRIDPNEPTL